jgi:hypothetical protein
MGQGADTSLPKAARSCQTRSAAADRADPSRNGAEAGRLVRGSAGTMLLCVLLAGCWSQPKPQVHYQSWRMGATAARTPATSAAPTTAHPAPARSRRNISADIAAASLDRLLEQTPGRTAVAVKDVADGQTLVRGAARSFATASIAKVDILAALMLERQDAGTPGLTPDQRDLATHMIEASDNTSADRLFRQAGGAWGLGHANRRFGLTGTSVHEPHWGLTTTTAGDQLLLLQEVFTSSSALDASSRAYIQRLMGQVDADQNWGVSAAADGHYALKNGWLLRPDGTWVVNSIGGVSHRGHLLLIAVLSDHDASETAGIGLTRSLATAAATAITGT